MTKQKIASWRKRRWTIFLKAYQASADFRKELEDYHAHKGSLYDQDNLEVILFKYGVSYLCGGAVNWYLENPNRDAGVYMKRILPPVFFGSSLSSSIAPPRPEYAKLSAEELRRNPKTKLPDDLHYNTEISIQPYVTKSELHELINEYWYEIEPRINQRTKYGDTIFGTKLLGKVQPEKHKKTRERDDMIMKLKSEGKNHTEILFKLSQHKSKFVIPKKEYLRVIISRNKSKTD